MLSEIDLADKLPQIREYWKPYTAGELKPVKLDKVKSKFVRHQYAKMTVGERPFQGRVRTPG